VRLVRVRRHVRLIDGSLRVIPAHWRRIADAEPDAGAVVRDDRTGELFGEVETICALAAMPDGAVIKGSLLKAARKEWR
jgi:hypothetical protein